MKTKAIKLLAILYLLLLSSCGTSYRVSTSFYSLSQGMSKNQFIQWAGLNDTKKTYKGKFPVHSKSFKHGNELWEVWVFEVYKFYGDMAIVDHHEHVAFKNGYLEEWGTGELPITIRQNPNQFQYDINVR